MALVLADRVRETTSSTGTTAVTLGGAYTGFQTFLAGIGNSNSTYYTISDSITGQWEVGIGTYTSSGNTLSRDTVLSSSNAGSLVSFTAGTKDVFVTQPSERNVYVVGSNVVAENSATVPNSLLANSAITINGNSVSLGGSTTVTAATPNALTLGSYLSGTSFNGSAAVTTNVNATSANTASAIVARDASGNFSAGTVTAVRFSGPLTGAVGDVTPSTVAATSVTASLDSEFTSTGALTIPVGTTGQQPTGANGKIRYNSTLSQYEGYNSASATWALLGGAVVSNDTSTASNVYPIFAAATSGNISTVYTSNAKLLYKPSTGEFQASTPVASNGIMVNSLTVATSYTIAAGFSGASAGPITIASGQSVTVAGGSRWVIS
jgi:hypothetical protein